MLFVNLVGRQTSVKTTYKTFAVWVGFMKKVFGRRNNVRQQKILLNKWNIFLYSWRPSHAISKSNENFSLFFYRNSEFTKENHRPKITHGRSSFYHVLLLLLVWPYGLWWGTLQMFTHKLQIYYLFFWCCYYTWKCVKGL